MDLTEVLLRLTNAVVSANGQVMSAGSDAASQLLNKVIDHKQDIEKYAVRVRNGADEQQVWDEVFGS